MMSALLALSATAALLLLLLIIACSSSVPSVHAFHPSSPAPLSFRLTTSKSTSTVSTVSTSTALEGRKIKRQLLSSIVEESGDDGIILSTPKRSKKANKKRNSSGKSGSSSGSGSGVSSDLASWAAGDGNDGNDDDDSTSTSTTTNERKTTTPAYVPFEPTTKQSKSSSSPRRARQAERSQFDKTQLKASQKLTDQLNTILQEGKNNLPDILSAIQNLIDFGAEQQTASSSTSSTFQSLVSSKQSQEDQTCYRLAWVGSDDAICHIGTGQHKVPLARLQEVFLTLQGKNRLELYEVISLFGPFPNLRNTLQGSSRVVVPANDNNNNNNNNNSSNDNNNVSTWKITWESIIDGTGKEYNSSDDKKNQQLVDLQIYFGDLNAIVAVVPPPSDSDNDNDSMMLLRDDPLEANGAHVLLFIREDDLDGKLDALRVI